jgi:hypothetical protein
MGKGIYDKRVRNHTQDASQKISELALIPIVKNQGMVLTPPQQYKHK